MTGESAYMPAMCRLTVTPTTLIEMPCPAMCTGVMDMMATITACATRIPLSAASAAG